MPLEIVELFGYPPDDKSVAAKAARKKFDCPILGIGCSKHLSDGTPSGVCTVRQSKSDPIICCPVRLYAEEYSILRDVANEAFGPGKKLISAGDFVRTPPKADCVVVFGKRWGGELRLPKRKGKGNYFVDWVLSHLDKSGNLLDFAAVEVQSIDTTGSYRKQRSEILEGISPLSKSKAGLNWENVAKRILPQLIYKGNVLRREVLCRKGLFFVTDSSVYMRIMERLGDKLEEYHKQPGSITFRWYGLSTELSPNGMRRVVPAGSFTTTTDQLSDALAKAHNLPDAGVYERAIKSALENA